MLLVGKDLASYTLAAGEPFVLEVQLLDSAGRGIDLDDQAMVLTFYTAGTRALVTDFAGAPSQYEGERLSDTTGEYFRWAFDGRWSEAMLSKPGLRVELAQRLFYGRSIISMGTLSVINSSAVVPSLPGGSIALTAVRVSIKANATLGGAPQITQTVILYDGPSVPIPAPVFTTPSSIASDGTPQVGELLTGIDGVATNAASYTRRWLLGSTLLTSSATYTPTTAGSYRYETIATGPGGETASGSNITVAAAAPVLNALTISPSTATAGTSTTITISGATAGSVITGTVPAGMTLNSAARTITGTPTTAGSPSIVLTETLAGATGSPRQSTVSVTIAAAPVTPSLGALTVSPSSATVGTAYSGTINGLTSGSSIALSGAGAAGLSIAGAVITGTPTTAGAVNIVETLAGATGSPRTSSAVITVAAAAVVLNPLTLSPSTATTGTAYTGTVSGKTSGSTLALSGAGAAGLTVSGSTVSGTPTTAGSVDIVETLAGATGSPRTSSGVLTVSAATANYAARTANTEPNTATLASPTSDTLIASAASALAGSTTGAGTWANLALGSNPGIHNRLADGSGVGGTAAGRAGSLLTGIVSADGEIAADLQVNAVSSEGLAGLLARASTDAAGTYYEMRYGYANTVQLFRVNAGVETQLALVNGLTGLSTGVAYPARMRLVDIADANGAVVSTSIRCFFNGAEIISIVDTAPLPVGVYGFRGGRNARFKNLTIAAWQIQSATVLTPNVYDASASGVVVSLLTTTTPGATMSLADNDGGRFTVVDTGRKTPGGRSQYNLVTAGVQTTIAGGNARSVVLRESKTGYAAKDTTVSLGVVAPLAAKPVRYVAANCGEHNTQAGGGASQDAWHTYALFPLGSVADDVRPVFRPMAIGGDGKEYLPCTAASIRKCSVMIEGGKFRVPVTFNGARGVTFPMAVTTIVEADPVTPAMFGLIEWPRNAQIRVCAQGRVTGAVPIGEVASQADTSTTFNQVYPSANEIDWIDDASIAPPNYAGKGTAAAAMFITAVVGKTTFGAVHALGDSLTYGFDESYNVIRFGAGWFGRMSNIAGIIPGYRAARAGILGQAYMGNGEGRRAMIAKGYATIGIDFFGTNDLNSAGTGDPSAINAMHTSVTADFKANGMKVLRGQLMPRATDYTVPLSSIIVSGTTATATITDATSVATLKVGQTIFLTGNAPTALNGLKTITAINGNTFDYTVASGTASATTVVGFSAAFSNQLQAIPAGWAGNGTSNRDVINAKNVSDASAGTIDGVIDFLSVVSQPGNSGLWKYDGITANLVISDGSGTHPNAAGHTLMATVARNAVVALAPELA